MKYSVGDKVRIIDPYIIKTYYNNNIDIGNLTYKIEKIYSTNMYPIYAFCVERGPSYFKEEEIAPAVNKKFYVYKRKEEK